MPKPQMSSLMLPLAASFLASVAGRPSEGPDYLDYADYPHYSDNSDYHPVPTENHPCRAVAPMAGFEPSLLDGEWEIPHHNDCQKVKFTRLADNLVHVRRSVMGNDTMEMKTPGVLKVGPPGLVVELTVIQGRADEYLMFYVCASRGPSRGGRAIMAMVRPSANLQDVNNLMDEQLSRADMSGDAAFTHVLHLEPNLCGVSA